MIIRKIFYIKTLPNALSFSSVLLWTNASVLFNSCLTSARLGRVQRQAWGMERTPKTKFMFEMSLSGGLPGNYRDIDRVFKFSWVWLVVLFGNGDPRWSQWDHTLLHCFCSLLFSTAPLCPALSSHPLPWGSRLLDTLFLNHGSLEILFIIS